MTYSLVKPLIGDFEDADRLLDLLESGAIVAPLTADSAHLVGHIAAFELHPLVHELRQRGTGGLIFFSSGTTGRPKAILHDFETFRRRYAVPRPARTTLSFLLWDHIGGINTLLHARATDSRVVRTKNRNPAYVMALCAAENVELLPTTPTFLRMIDHATVPQCIKTITYGTERMDEATLARLAAALPWVDFRQTYGASELGILKVRSKARDSTWMSIDSEWSLTPHGTLSVRSPTAMMGYLNAPSPFDAEGWFDTGDTIETNTVLTDPVAWIRIVGRRGDTINVGGVKIHPSEVEQPALAYPGVLRARAKGVPNMLIGNAIELVVEPRPGETLSVAALKAHLAGLLPEGSRPHRIVIGEIPVNYRMKEMG